MDGESPNAGLRSVGSDPSILGPASCNPLFTSSFCGTLRPMPRILTGLALVLASLVLASPAPAQGRKPRGSAPAKPPASSAPVLPTAPKTGLAGGLEALARSDYATAEKELTAASKGGERQKALLGLARLNLAVGKYKEAADTADLAIRAGKTRERLDATAVKAQALADQGKVAEAVAAVESVKDDADARRARLVLGELLIAQGKSADARDPLMSIISDYNNDAIPNTDGEGLAMVGRAAHLLRHAQDANDAYMQAEHAPPPRVETLLWRAELFLEKYDTGHAEEVIRDALKIAPKNPDALVLLAKIKLDQSLDFDAAESNVNKALAVNPRHAGAFAVRAGVALRDFDLAAADAALDEGLRTNPSELELLSMKAAVRLLADDRPGFDAARKKVLAINAEYSNMYTLIGEFADWEHRYDDIVNMMKDAVTVDPRDGKAWAVLGLNQIRLGDDTAALDSLRKAWQFDKFNPRVLNTLNLYEKEIPVKYETVEAGHFKYRFDKEERPILERYVPPMLEEAFGAMVKHYGMTPTLPVGIELYSNREHFSVRTSGLPHVGIQGVCFGRTLAAPSPGGEPFNWGNVLWHELGHVFAIQLSKAHVPRWFTEGLSEYETFVRRSEWQREEDQALYSAMVANRIPKLANFNRAFTHAEDAGDNHGAALVHCGERHTQQVGIVDVARADHGDVFGNAQPRFQNGLDGPGRHRIVVAEDAVRARRSAQQQLHGLIPGVVAILSAGNVAGRRYNSVPRQRAPVPAQTSCSGGHRRSANMRHPPAALADEMFRGERPQFVILHADEMGLRSRQHAVNQYVRDLGAGQHLKQLQPPVVLRRGDDQAVDLAAHQHAHLPPLHFGILPGIRNDHLVTQRLQLARHAFGHFGKEGMHQVGQHQSHHVSAARDHAAGDPIRLVIEFPHAFEDEVAGLLADVVVMAQRLGNRHQRNAEVLGNILHPNGQTRFPPGK